MVRKQVAKVLQHVVIDRGVVNRGCGVSHLAQIINDLNLISSVDLNSMTFVGKLLYATMN